MGVVQTMKSHQLFQSLSFEEVDRVSSFSGAKSYEKGGVVFQAGDFASHIFVVREGRVDLRIFCPDGDSSLVIGRMGQGDIFGWSPLLGADRYTTTALCAEKSSILAIEVAPFRALLQEKAQVGQDVMRVVARAYFSRYIEILKRFQAVLSDIAAAP